MSNISRKMRLIIAGTLLALTAMAIGLTMSVAFNAQASVPAATTPNAPVAQTSSEDFTLNSPEDLMQFAPAFMAQAPGFTGAMMAGPLGAANGPEAQGVITKIDGATLTLNNGRRNVVTSPTTKFGDANGEIKITDLKVNDRIFALGKVDGTNLAANWVLKLSELPAVQRGKITSVDAAANQFKFTVGKDEWTATVTASTVISKSGKTATLTELAKDDQVVVSGKADRTAKTIEAVRVVDGLLARTNPGGKGVAPRGNALQGTVKSADAAANTLVVTQKVNSVDTDVTVKTTSTTKFVGLNGLGDLKAGDVVSVVGAKQTDNTVLATIVSKGQVAGPKPGAKGNGGAMPNGGMRGGRGGQAQPKTTPTANQ